MHVEETSTLTIEMYQSQVEALQFEVKRLNKRIELLKADSGLYQSGYDAGYQQGYESSTARDDALHKIHTKIIEEIDDLEWHLQRSRDKIATLDDPSLAEDRADEECRAAEIEYEIEQLQERLQDLGYDGSY